MDGLDQLPSADPSAPAVPPDLSSMPPAPMSAPTADADIPMDPKDLRQWKTRIDRARRRRDGLKEEWQRLLESYTGRPGGSQPAEGTVETCKTFADVEQKKAQLFYDTPLITLTPQQPLAQGLDDAILVHETILNAYLGRNGVDAKRVVDKALFDVLCTSGIGFTKIGYQAYVTQVEPIAQPGSILGLSGPPQPVPVYEEIFWNWFSPLKGLLPDEFRDTDTDQALWIGMEFTKPLAVAKRDYTLPENFSGRASTDDNQFDAEANKPNTDGSADLVRGIEIWYRPAFFDNTGIVHPLVQRRLVLLDGLEDRPAKHTASPYQTLTNNRLTPDSMIGFPIHTFSVRDLSDAAYPYSDAAMTEQLNKEENRFRSQMIKLRDAAVPMTFYDEGAITPDTIEKIEQGEIGSWHGIEEGKLSQGLDKIVAVAQRPELGRENYEAQRVIAQDRNEILAISAVQRGNTNTNVVSATEVESVQAATDVRLSAERNRVVNAFLKGVAKLDALVQRFGPTMPTNIQIIGANGEAAWKQWDKSTVAGRFLYNITPDSGVKIDEAQQRSFALKTYEFLRKDPLVNPQELLRVIAPALHLSPSALIKPPEPPKGPEPNFSYRFGGADMGNPLAVALIINGGQLTQQAIQQAIQLIQSGGNPTIVPPGEPPRGLEGAYQAQVGAPVQPHPGLADKMAPMSKHTADLSGNRDGRPAGPQGTVQ